MHHDGDAPEPVLNIRRAADGSWTVHPQPPLPTVTLTLTGGWGHIADLRERWGALDWFPVSSDYRRFVEEFGPPPDPDRPHHL